MEKITRLGFTLLLMCIWSFANAQSDTTQVTDFTLVEQQITLRIGESCQLHVNPSDAEVKWMESWDLSSDPVIIVDENGLITALKAGNAVVGVESRGGSVMRYCQVAVLEEGNVRKEKKSLAPVEESEWADVNYILTNDGTFSARGTYYGSGAQTNYLNYVMTEQCVFLWFDVNFEDSTKMFYLQPFSLEIKDCNAQKYNIYLDNILGLLMMPITLPHIADMVIGAGVGLLMDVFCNSLGIHTAACILIMFIRPYLIGAIVNDKDRLNEQISLRSIGMEALIKYVVILVLVHHLTVFLLAAWSWAHIGFVLLETLISGLITCLIVIGYNILKYR